MSRKNRKATPTDHLPQLAPAMGGGANDCSSAEPTEQVAGQRDTSELQFDGLEEIIVSGSVAHLFPVYLARVAKVSGEIDGHLREGDLRSVSIIGHNLKGTGGTYGFNMLSKLGGQIELAAQAGDTVQIRASADDLVVWLKRVRWKVAG
jgi:hypothetical protein